MDFTNSFTVRAPLDTVWRFMLNAEEVAPCVPGAAITETIDETHYKGTVKIKLGAVQMNYRGALEMQPDESAHTIVLAANGTETRGSGGARGTFTAVLVPVDDGTRVDIASKVDITGRVAQFGRGIMQDVGTRLVNQFAACLEEKLQQYDPASESNNGATNAASRSVEATIVSAPGTPSQQGTQTAEQNAMQAAPGAGIGENELQMGPLILDLVRSRIAAGLRAIAHRLESH